MIKIQSKATQSEIEVGRYIGKFEADPKLPSVVVFGGIHGNEPSGVFALQVVCDHIIKNEIKINGSFYAISGNMCALPKGKRYCETDLNRIWTHQHLDVLKVDPIGEDELPSEYLQMKEIMNEIEYIIARNKGPIYFIDLHTTSSQSCPFIPINDTLANRAFAMKFPVPIVLGIEEFIEGPLLSYINEIDHVCLGFEGGQHDDKKSIQHQIAFVSLSLLYANLITKIEFPDYLEYLNALQQACKEEKGVYEILYKYELKQDDHFCMLPGFKSFDRIAKNQRLAEHNGKMVCSKEEGKIFMPLYQSQGEDGFFIIRSVSQFWLLLSAKLRQFRMEKFLICLPGVSRDIKNPKALRIDKNTARFLAKEIFHLLGFRMKKKENNVLIFTRRERI